MRVNAVEVRDRTGQEYKDHVGFLELIMSQHQVFVIVDWRNLT